MTQKRFHPVIYTEEESLGPALQWTWRLKQSDVYVKKPGTLNEIRKG